MVTCNLHLLSAYLKKWSYNENKITINYSFCAECGYERSFIDLRIAAPAHMTNEIMNNIFYKAKEVGLRSKKKGEELSPQDVKIILVNEFDIKRKISIFLSKILKEYNQNKKSRGRSRMITTRSLDFYYNDFEFEPLSNEIKFFVHLNRGINKINGDLWTNAIEDLKNALNIDPDHPLGNRQMAHALNKVGKTKESIAFLQKYAELEDTPESLNLLALTYVNLADYKEADKIFKKLIKKHPDSNVVLFGMAQLAYKQDKGYKTILDKIHKKNPDWLEEKIKSDWDFKRLELADDEQKMWNAATSARYLGFDRPFDLTRRAFNDEIPSYFNSEKGTIRFVRIELDCWVDIMNRFKINGGGLETYEDKLSAEEIEKGKPRKKKTVTKRKTKSENGVKNNTVA